MAVLMTPPFQQFFDDDGNPLVDGKIYTYAAGTTNPKAAYTTAAGDIELANPIPLDSAGRAVVFILGSYKFVITDANDNVIRTVDNVVSFNVTANQSDSFFQSLSGNGSQTVFTLSSDLGTDENGILVFVDNGIPEYVTNGDFATDTVWTKGAGWSIGSGVATATGAISTDISQTSSISLIAGQPYVATYTVTRSAGSITPNIGGTAGTARSASGTYTEIIVAGATQTLAFNTAGFTGTLDNVSVKPLMSIGRQILTPSQFTIDGDEITFVDAPKTGTNNIMIWALSLLVGAASSAAALAEQFRDQAQQYRDEAEGYRDEAEGYRDDTQALYAQIISSEFVLYGTSTTSLTIGTGSKVFTTQAGKQWVLGQRLRAASDDGTMIMEGEVTDYTGDQLTLNVDYTEGAGTHAVWNIGVAGARGSDGLQSSRNLLINGQFRFNERAAASVADDAYGFDRWNQLSQTANVTVSQLSNAENGQVTSLRITQPNATAQRVGTSQIIESATCRYLRGDDAHFKARIRCSQSQAIRYAILEWTGTADTVTSDVVNDWTSGSFTTGNFFNSTSLTLVATGSVTPAANTWTDLEGGAAVSGSMNNLIAMVWTEGTLAQNETLDIGLAQLEQGDAASVFEYRPVGMEYDLCRRFYQRYPFASNEILGTTQSYTTAAAFGRLFSLTSPLRSKSGGTLAVSAAGDFTGSNGSGATTAFATFTLGHAGGGINLVNSAVASTPFTVGQANVIRSNNANAYIEISQEL